MAKCLKCGGEVVNPEKGRVTGAKPEEERKNFPKEGKAQFGEEVASRKS